MLKKRANKLSMSYIDITSNILGENELVNDKFLSSDVNDHHLSDEKTYLLWLNEIEEFIS
jgi:hypothetical protein